MIKNKTLGFALPVDEWWNQCVSAYGKTQACVSLSRATTKLWQCFWCLWQFF